jgi:5-methylcytosine-specific restriction endonuclease McrA
MKRNRAFRKRVPQWLTEEHWLAINAFYLEAERKTKETGIKHHVDHIHPLRGKTVSGLHVPWNLQVLTRDENLQKAAKL